MVEFPFKPDFDVLERCLYLVFCISLEVEEDEEKTHETTGIGVIEAVPSHWSSCPMYLLCISLSMVEIFLFLQILLYSASSTSWFSLIMEIPEGSNMERSRDVGDAGRCSKQSNKRSYGAKKKRFAGKPKQKRWNFPHEGRHLMWKGIDFILDDMVASFSCSRMF